jgi:hypothetical protein
VIGHALANLGYRTKSGQRGFTGIQGVLEGGSSGVISNFRFFSFGLKIAFGYTDSILKDLLF